MNKKVTKALSFHYFPPHMLTAQRVSFPEFLSKLKMLQLKSFQLNKKPPDENFVDFIVSIRL
jgi:hypothetical protein